MPYIVVDTDFLRKAGHLLSQVAGGIRSAGSSAASAAAGAPSYDGQFGPKVRAIGSEAKSKAGSLASTLRDMGGNLVALAAAFEAVDLQTVEGLGALGPFVGPMPQIPDLNGDGVIDLADLAFYNPYLPFSDDQPFPSVTWAQSPSPVVMFLRGLKLNPLARVIPTLPDPSFDDLSQAWQNAKDVWGYASQGDYSSAFWSYVNAGLFAIGKHDAAVNFFTNGMDAVARRQADWRIVSSNRPWTERLGAATRLGIEGEIWAVGLTGAAGVGPALPGGVLENALAEGGHTTGLKSVYLITQALGGKPTYDPWQTLGARWSPPPRVSGSHYDPLYNRIYVNQAQAQRLDATVGRQGWTKTHELGHWIEQNAAGRQFRFNETAQAFGHTDPIRGTAPYMNNNPAAQARQAIDGNLSYWLRPGEMMADYLEVIINTGIIP